MAKIVIYGNPVDGFQYAGPFADGDEAIAWREGSNGTDTDADWWLASLQDPPTKELSIQEQLATIERLTITDCIAFFGLDNNGAEMRSILMAMSLRPRRSRRR